MHEQNFAYTVEAKLNSEHLKMSIALGTEVGETWGLGQALGPARGNTEMCLVAIGLLIFRVSPNPECNHSNEQTVMMNGSSQHTKYVFECLFYFFYPICSIRQVQHIL